MARMQPWSAGMRRFGSPSRNTHRKPHDSTVLAIDELHHVFTDTEANRSARLREVMNGPDEHISAMTTYRRRPEAHTLETRLSLRTAGALSTNPTRHMVHYRHSKFSGGASAG